MNLIFTTILKNKSDLIILFQLMKSSRLVELSKEIENCRVIRNGVIENEDNENSLEERLKELTDFSYGVLNSFGLSSSAQNLQNSSLRGAIITSAILDPEGKLD